MAIRSANITVTTSPTLLVEGDSSAESVYLHSSSGTLYLGGSAVTSGTGYRMDNGDKLTINNSESPIYAITSSGTSSISMLVITK